MKNLTTNKLHKFADLADKIALKYFQQVDLAIEYKKDNSPVSAADKAIEQTISNYLKKHYPQLGIFGEEFGTTQATGSSRLIIDPIDGTRNFLRGIPIFATLLAVEENGQITAGLVSAPAMGLRWWADKGCGAFMKNNNTKKTLKLQVSSIKKIETSQIFHSSLAGNELTDKRLQENLIELLKCSQRQRGMGDFYQHMLVAQGSGEAAIDPLVSPWDIAAIKIIVEESGGQLTAISGKNSIYENSAVSSNGAIHQLILKELN